MINQIVIKGEKFNYTSIPDIGATGLIKGAETTLTVTFTGDLVTTNDIGRPITIIVSTNQAVYFTETLVQASTAGSV